MNQSMCFARIIECGGECINKKKGVKELEVLMSDMSQPVLRKRPSRNSPPSKSPPRQLSPTSSQASPEQATSLLTIMAGVVESQRPNHAAEEGYMHFMQCLKGEGDNFNLWEFNSRGQVMVNSARKGFRKSLDCNQFNQLKEGRIIFHDFKIHFEHQKCRQNFKENILGQTLGCHGG